jgi:hypothetical protein
MAQPGREVISYTSTCSGDTSILATHRGHDNSIGRILASAHLICGPPACGTVLL